MLSETQWPFFGARGELVRVPAGKFFMGCDPQKDDLCQDDERPGHRVQLGTYWIDRTEVTLRQYEQCVSAGRCTPPGTGERCNWKVEGRGDHPVNCVDWHQAEAYCAWAGKRLPTEAEWEKAARGMDGRRYPWGDEPPDCERAVMVQGRSGCGRQSTWPVCSKKAGNSPYGLCDASGNVWEWVADWYEADHYLRAESRDPRGPASGEHRAERGGSFYGTAGYLRVSNRDRDRPVVRSDAIGFRCAKSDGKPK